MGISVKFYDMQGHEKTTRQFQPNESIDVNVFANDTVGIPVPFATVTCQILSGTSVILAGNHNTNFWGTTDFQFVFPSDVSGYGSVKITVQFPLGPQNAPDIPIAFGSNQPAPQENNDDDTVTKWLKLLRDNLLIIGALGVGAYFVFRKVRKGRA